MKLIEQKIDLPVAYTVPPSTIIARDELLAAMDEPLLETIHDEADLAIVVAQGVKLQAHIKEVQATRLQLSRPLINAGSLLLEHERSYLRPVLEAKTRRETLVTEYRQRERLRLEEKERYRQAEIQKLESERVAAEQAAAKSGRSKKAIAQQIAAEQAAHEASEAQQELMRLPVAEPVQAKGAATGKRLGWRVTDIHALYKARPELCKLEPKPSAIQAVCVPEIPIAGLDLWWEDKTTFRR